MAAAAAAAVVAAAAAAVQQPAVVDPPPAVVDPLPSAVLDVPTCLLRHLQINNDTDFVNERDERLDFCWQAVLGARPEPVRREQLFLFPSMLPHMADMFCMSVIQDPKRPITHGAATFGMALLTYYFTSDIPTDRMQFTAINELQRRVLESAAIIAPNADDRRRRGSSSLASSSSSSSKPLSGRRARRAAVFIDKPAKTDGCGKSSSEPPSASSSSSAAEPSDRPSDRPVVEASKAAARAYTQGCSRDWHDIASCLLHYLLIGAKTDVSRKSAAKLPPHRHPLVVEAGFLSYLLLTTQLHPVRIRYAHLTPTELLLMTLDADSHNEFLRRNRISTADRRRDRQAFQVRHSVTYPKGKRPAVLFGVDAAEIPSITTDVRRILARLVGKPERQLLLLTALAEIGISVADTMIGASKRPTAGPEDTERMLQIGYVLTEFVQVAAMAFKLLTADDFRDKSYAIAADRADTPITTATMDAELKQRRDKLQKKLDWFVKLASIDEAAKKAKLPEAVRYGSWSFEPTTGSYTFRYRPLNGGKKTESKSKSKTVVNSAFDETASRIVELLNAPMPSKSTDSVPRLFNITLSSSAICIRLKYEGVYAVGTEPAPPSPDLDGQLAAEVLKIRLAIWKSMPCVIFSDAKKTASSTTTATTTDSKIESMLFDGSPKPLVATAKKRVKKGRLPRPPVLSASSASSSSSPASSSDVGCFVVATAPNLATYDGEVRGKRFHGFGACMSAGGYCYIGFWNDGKRDFFGVEDYGKNSWTVQYDSDKIIERIPFAPMRDTPLNLQPFADLDAAVTRCLTHELAGTVVSKTWLDRLRCRSDRLRHVRNLIDGAALPASARRRIDVGIARLLTSEIDFFAVALWKHHVDDNKPFWPIRIPQTSGRCMTESATGRSVARMLMDIPACDNGRNGISVPMQRFFIAVLVLAFLVDSLHGHIRPSDNDGDDKRFAVGMHLDHIRQLVAQVVRTSVLQADLSVASNSVDVKADGLLVSAGPAAVAVVMEPNPAIQTNVLAASVVLPPSVVVPPSVVLPASAVLPPSADSAPRPTIPPQPITTPQPPPTKSAEPPVDACRSSCCRKPNARLRCSCSQSIRYCSQTCQKADWPTHRPACGYKPAVVKK